MNYYVVLGIPSNADEAAIRSAYSSLVRLYHPDRGAGSSPEKFRHIVEAYETLSDPVRRRDHDRALHVTQPAPVVFRPATVSVESISAWTRRAEPLSPTGQRGRRLDRFEDLFDELWSELQRDWIHSRRR